MSSNLILSVQPFSFKKRKGLRSQKKTLQTGEKFMDPNKAHYVAVTAIIVKDGKFLIVKRAPGEKTFPNKWTVPGGRLEVDDYTKKPKDTADAWYDVAEELVRREVRE